MKAQFLSVLTALALVGFISTTPVFAAETEPTDQSQNVEHHPETAAKAPTSPSKMKSSNEMMGKMDMEHMKGMMNECMQTQKDGKMCDQEMMKQCHGKMSKTECKKMMNHAKAQNNSINEK